ncbi:MAG: sulfurtransferase [Alteromonadaceae bacterium]|nr:MAG: sulfurtransferase [Alteromonadaceae bacterium]
MVHQEHHLACWCILRHNLSGIFWGVCVNWLVFVSEQWLLVSLLAVLVSALIFVESRKGGTSLSLHEVTRMLNADEAILLDVREAKEFKAGHITGAVNIPHLKLASRAEELEKHKSKTIIVVDKAGQHGGASGKLLKDLGYTVNRMQGGMAEWQGQNLPVIKGN